MEKKSRIFVGVLLIALGFAAGTLFGPGQALSDQWGTCSGGGLEITSTGKVWH